MPNYVFSAILYSISSRGFESLYSPDKVHLVANNKNKNNIKLTNLTINNIQLYETINSIPRKTAAGSHTVSHLP